MADGDDSPKEFENLINSESVLKEFREFVNQEWNTYMEWHEHIINKMGVWDDGTNDNIEWFSRNTINRFNTNRNRGISIWVGDSMIIMTPEFHFIMALFLGAYILLNWR